MTRSSDEPLPVMCPFCSSVRSELVSAMGSSLLTSHRRCLACQSYFEAARRPPSSDMRPSSVNPRTREVP